MVDQRLKLQKFRRYTQPPKGFFNGSARLLWQGCKDVSFTPIVERGMEHDVVYSLNKRKRWELKKELETYMKDVAPDALRVVCGLDPIFPKKPVFAFQSGRLPTSKDNNGENPNTISATGQLQSKKMKQRQHRNHHRPIARDVESEKKQAAPAKTSLQASYVIFEQPFCYKMRTGPKCDSYYINWRKHETKKELEQLSRRITHWKSDDHLDYNYLDSYFSDADSEDEIITDTDVQTDWIPPTEMVEDLCASEESELQTIASDDDGLDWVIVPDGSDGTQSLSGALSESASDDDASNVGRQTTICRQM